MAAGLGFKDFTTGEVLTAADVDGYLMQGIWVFANATARDAAVTSPQEGNACYLKDTDVIQVYTGSSWAAQSASNPISANIVDAKGDIIAATAADTVSRLAVGANNTVLTADSSTATGLKWSTPAGGSNIGLKTTVAKTSFSAVSTLNIDNIFSSTYENYKIFLFGTSSTQNEIRLAMRTGGTTNTTATNYRNQNFLYGSDGGSIFTPSNGTNAFLLIGNAVNTTGWSLIVDVCSPFSSSVRTNVMTRGAYELSANVGVNMVQGGSVIVNTSYDGIALTTSAGTITGNYVVYGYGETV